MVNTMVYRIVKTPDEHYLVKFQCENCQSWLSENLRRAGMPDVCPGCQRGVSIPGQKALQALSEGRLNLRAGNQEESSSDSTSRPEIVGAEEREPVGNEEKAFDASASQPKESSGEDEQDQQSDVQQWLGEFDAANTGSRSHLDLERSQAPASKSDPQESELESAVGGSVDFKDSRPRPRHAKKKKKWWSDSISFGSVSETRYPALMAYRNAMVLLWWLFSSVATIGALIVPIGNLYVNVVSYRSENARLDERVLELDSPLIGAAMELARGGKGMEEGQVYALSLALPFDYPVTNRFGLNDLDPKELSRFATDFANWRSAELAEVERSRPSGFAQMMAGVGSTLLYLGGLLCIAVVYSIVLLVPPECIKLAIDVESGIRALTVN